MADSGAACGDIMDRSGRVIVVGTHERRHGMRTLARVRKALVAESLQQRLWHLNCRL